MNITDKDEIIKRMMAGSDAIRKNRNKALKTIRRKNRDGKISKSHKIALGKHMNSHELETEYLE